MQVQEKYLHRFQKTHRHVTPHFLCPQVPKKIRPGPKDMCGSKKQKTCIPIYCVPCRPNEKMRNVYSRRSNATSSTKRTCPAVSWSLGPHVGAESIETIDECTQTLSLGRKGVNEHLLLSDAIRSWLQGQKDSAYLFTCSVKLVVYRLWPMSTMRTILATALANWIARDSIPGYTRPFHHAWGASPAPLTASESRGQSVQGLLQAWILLEKTWHDGCTAMKHILLPCPSLHWWRLSDAVEGQEAIEGPCFLWKEKIHIHANDLDVMWQNKELSVFMTNSWAASPGGLHDTRPVAFSRKALGTSLLVLSWIATVSIKQVKQDFSLQNG